MLQANKFFFLIKNISIAYILLVAFLSLFAYFIIPDKSTNANQMHLSIHSKSPGFKVDLLLIENNIKYDQTLFEKLFFGNKNSPTEIALQNYNLNKRTFYYNEYGDFSNEFNKVYSFISNNFWNHDVEDNAYIMMEDSKGRVAMIHSTATEWKHKFRLEITLEKAQLELSGILSSSKSYGEERLIITKRKKDNKNSNPIEKIHKYSVDNSWKKEIDEFAENIINNEPITNGNSSDALSVMKLIYMIYTSDKRWKKMFNIQKMSNINKLAKSSKSIGDFTSQYIDYLQNILQSIDKKQIEKLVRELNIARKNGNTIFIIGNGGSATTATSMANDLGFDIIKKTKTKKPFRFMALTDSNAVITAISNDLDYSEVFINQLKIHFRKGDKLIAISASGNSDNLIKAVKWVKANKGKVISFLGFDGGKLLKLSDITIHTKSEKGDYGPVEDSHLLVNHLLAHWFQNHINSQKIKLHIKKR